jgi:hypothetical protein
VGLATNSIVSTGNKKSFKISDFEGFQILNDPTGTKPELFAGGFGAFE